MNSLVGCLVMSLALTVQTLPVSKVPGFEDGKRYVYEYRVRMATGVADADAKQFSGYGVKAKLAVENHDGQVYMQYYDLEIGPFNGRIDAGLYEPLVINYEKVDVANSPVYQHLTTPFAVNFENGVIKSLDFDEVVGESEFNVLKAIAALLQLNLDPSPEKDEHFYHVYEDGIGGDCLTLYNIAHEPPEDTPDVQVLNVTKSRFYDQCKYRPHLFHISMEGWKCTDCKNTNFEPLRTLSEIEYQIKGNRQEYTIERVEANGVVGLTPFTSNGQTILSVINQTLVLLTTEEETNLTKPSTTKSVINLSFNFTIDKRNHEEVDLKESHLHIQVNHNHEKPLTDKLEALVPLLVQRFKDKGDESSTVAEAIKAMRSFSYEHFVKWFEVNLRNFADDPTEGEKTIKAILFEIFPYVGSNPSILYMFHLIETKTVDHETANSWLQKIPFHVKEPSKTLLIEFKRLIQQEPITKYTKLVNSGWLAYGTLMHRGCNSSNFNPHPSSAGHYIDEGTCKGFVTELIEKFDGAHTETEQAVYLRAIKNTRSPSAFKFLLSIARGSYSVLLRKESLWALFLHLTHGAEQIVAVGASIATNFQEDYVLRIFAFELIFYLNPTPQFFGSILLKLQHEPSEKVASYVYSMLVTSANSTDPCFEKYAENAKHLLQFIEKPQFDVLRHSFTKMYSFHNAQYNFGRSNYFAFIPSNVSVFPRMMYFGQRLNILGYNFDILELGYLSGGSNVFEYTLVNALQPEGLSPGKKKSGAIRPYLLYLVEKLKLQDAIREEIRDYEVFAKVFNQDVFYSRAFGFEEGSRLGGSEIKYDGQKIVLNVHSIGYVDARLVIPNEVGLPVYLQVKLPLTHGIAGSVKLTPQLSTDNELALSKRLQGLVAEFDVHFTTDFTVETKMYVESLVGVDYGYELKTRGGIKFPIKSSIDYDFTTRKLAIKYVPSTEPYDVLHYSTVPSTFRGDETLPIRYAEKPINRQYQYGHQYFGVGITLNFTHDYYWNDFGSYRNFFKSFFKKSYRHEDYFSLADKWFAGTREFMDYVVINPTGKPFTLNVRYAPCKTHPTTEFSLVSLSDYFTDYDNENTWTKLKWNLDIEGKNSNSKRTWNIEIRGASHYPEKDFRSVAFRFRHVTEDNGQFELCYNGNLTFKDYLSIYSQQPADVKVKYNGHFISGSQCTNESPQVIIKGLGEKSEEQNTLDKKKISFYRECVANTKLGLHFSDACWKVVKDMGRIDKFTLDIEHLNISKQMKSTFLNFYSYFRHYFYDNLVIEPFHGTTEENHIKVVTNFSYEHPVADVHVYHPDQTVHYHNIFVPSIFPRYEPYSIAEPVLTRLARNVFNFHNPMCIVAADFVRTFDGVTYSHPFENSVYLVFADCLHHQINVLVNGSKDGKFTKSLRAFFHNVQVDIEPDANGLSVLVNDKKVSLENRAIYQHMDIDTGRVSFIISNYAGGVYVWGKAYSAELYFDGVNLYIDASNFYRGRQCGLCGNFDGESDREFVGPDRTLYKNPTDFAKSYAVYTHG